MFLFLLLFFAPASIAEETANFKRMADGLKFPAICENHPFASKAVHGGTDGNGGYSCTLTFPFFTKSNERVQLCHDMFPDRLVSSSGDDWTTTCNYKRNSNCNDGYTLIAGMCYGLHKDRDTYPDASAKCRSDGGHITGDSEAEDLKFILYLANPVIYGIDAREIWVGEDRQMILRRGIDFRGLLGQIVPAYATKSRFVCVKPALRTRAAYKLFCDTARDSLKLVAHFHMGNCFMLSPSASVDHAIKTNGAAESISQREKDFQHFHDNCKWLTNNDYSVSPMTNGTEGMAELLKQHNRNHYVILPGWYDESSKNPFIMNKNINKNTMFTEEVQPGAFLWASREPDSPLNGGDGPMKSLVMGKKEDHFLLRRMPSHFRGRRICSAGVSMDEKPRQSCNEPNSPNKHLRKGWRSILRDDGTPMCLKAFVKDVDDRSITYACMDFDAFKRHCNSIGADTHVAPIQSAEEQSLVQEVIADHLKEIGETSIQSVWVGGKKLAPFDATGSAANLIWDYDGKPFGYKNWAGGEPNSWGSIENCVQMYTTASDKYQWNDINCDVKCRDDRFGIMGGVCARMLQKGF